MQCCPWVPAVRWMCVGFLFGVCTAAAFGFAWRGADERRPISANTIDDSELNRSFVSHTIRKKTAAPTSQADEGESSSDGGLRIIAFGAHPDDCEIRCGGTAILWDKAGFKVKFVSATNGDIGHWKMAGGPLAQRRYREVQQAAQLLRVTTTVLGIHDGELMPTLENRRIFTRQIRRWNADVVLSHRPNDYHPDHRYTGVLVQDSAFMVAVPYFCPETKHLDRNPIFLFYWDRFKQPYPFEPDVAVSIDSVIEQKVDALVLMESQFVEGGALGYTRDFPDTPDKLDAARKRVRDSFKRRFAETADQYRAKLVELYGEEQGKAVQYAEAFEVCEYGKQPSKGELLNVFPFVKR